MCEDDHCVAYSVCSCNHNYSSNCDRPGDKGNFLTVFWLTAESGGSIFKYISYQNDRKYRKDYL